MILIFATLSYFAMKSVTTIWVKNRMGRQKMADFALGATNLLGKGKKLFLLIYISCKKSGLCRIIFVEKLILETRVPCSRENKT